MNQEALASFSIPRWAQLPDLALYMDQVLLVLEPILAPMCAADERAITSTMINNYVKQKLVPAPDKKKYQRTQLARLLVVSVMKRVLSMNELSAILDPLTAQLGAEAAYDLFCQKLEDTMHRAFSQGEVYAGITGTTAEDALSAALAALAGKLLAQSITAQTPTAQG